MTAREQAERNAAVAEVRTAKALADAQRDAARHERQQVIEAEAERYAREHEMIAEEPPGRCQPTPREVLDLLGGPEHASAALTDPAKLAGLPRVISYGDLADHRAREELFYRAGGGRLPGQQPPPPRSSGTGSAPLPREWEADAKAGRLWTVSGEQVTP